MLTHKRLSAATAALTALAASLILYYPCALLRSGVRLGADGSGQQAGHELPRSSPLREALGEAWVELDGKGDLLRVRMDFPEPPTGLRYLNPFGRRTEVWFKDRNLRGIFDNKKMIRECC